MLANQPPLSPSEVYSGVTTPQLGARGQAILSLPEWEGTSLDDLYQVIRDLYNEFSRTGLLDRFPPVLTDYANRLDLSVDDIAAALNMSADQARALFTPVNARTLQLRELWQATVDALQNTVLFDPVGSASIFLAQSMTSINASAAELAAANGISVSAVNDLLEQARIATERQAAERAAWEANITAYQRAQAEAAAQQYVFGDFTLPQGWYQFTPAQKAAWFNQNNVTPTQLRAAGVPDEDMAYLRQAGYTVQDAGSAAPVEPVQVVVEDQSRGIDATTVVTAPAAPSDQTVEPEIIYDIPFPDVSIREVPETTPPVETPAPATGVTAMEQYVFGDITLPQGWYQFTPAQKATWFNQNNVTPTRLRAAGVPDQDIVYLRQAGYTIQDATTVAPVSPVAPAAGNLLPLALAAAFVLFGG